MSWRRSPTSGAFCEPSLQPTSHQPHRHADWRSPAKARRPFPPDAMVGLSANAVADVAGSAGLTATQEFRTESRADLR